MKVKPTGGGREGGKEDNNKLAPGVSTFSWKCVRWEETDMDWRGQTDTTSNTVEKHLYPQLARPIFFLQSCSDASSVFFWTLQSYINWALGNTSCRELCDQGVCSGNGWKCCISHDFKGPLFDAHRHLLSSKKESTVFVWIFITIYCCAFICQS